MEKQTTPQMFWSVSDIAVEFKMTVKVSWMLEKQKSEN